MNKTEMLNEKKLERLQDLVTSLENLGYYEEAEELQEYLLNPRATAGYIVEKFKGLFESITQDLDTDGLDCRRDEEGNQYEWDLKWIEKIMDVEIDYNWYKDVVKYDRCYLFFDNVLDRWMVRGEQRIWLSNIDLTFQTEALIASVCFFAKLVKDILPHCFNNVYCLNCLTYCKSCCTIWGRWENEKYSSIFWSETGHEQWYLRGFSL